MSEEYKNPALAVDAIVARSEGVLLIRRASEPFAGSWALPGGFVEYGETLRAALERELLEETGLSVVSASLFNVYSEPGRDPRKHVVSVVYVAEASGEPRAGDDAAETGFFPPDLLPPLAFDHGRILSEWAAFNRGRS